MKIRKKTILINGFGRIGRAVLKIILNSNNFNVLAINDKNLDIENMAYLYKYDSTYGINNQKISVTKSGLCINGKNIKYMSHMNLMDAFEKIKHIDLLIDSSGIAENISIHKKLIELGKIKKSIVTNSFLGVDNEIIMGINDTSYSNNQNIISASICDSNAAAHILYWINENFTIEGGSLTTLHPWLSYQNLVDGVSISQSNPGIAWKDYALGRASSKSLIPKNTSAMNVIEKVIPQLKGKILSFSYRTPTDIVSSCDITLLIKKNINEEKLKKFLKSKVENSKFVTINEESLVSLDYIKNNNSAILDMQWVKVSKNLIKIILWYDNEWGYSNRVVDLAYLITKDLR